MNLINFFHYIPYYYSLLESPSFNRKNPLGSPEFPQLIDKWVERKTIFPIHTVNGMERMVIDDVKKELEEIEEKIALEKRKNAEERQINILKKKKIELYTYFPFLHDCIVLFNEGKEYITFHSEVLKIKKSRFIESLTSGRFLSPKISINKDLEEKFPHLLYYIQLPNNEMKKETFSYLLNYFNNERFDLKEIEQILDFCSLTEYLGVDLENIKEICTQKLIELNCSIETWLVLFSSPSLNTQNRSDPLYNQAYQEITRQFDEILQKFDLSHLPFSSLLTLLSSDELMIENEFKIFEFLKNWIQNQSLLSLEQLQSLYSLIRIEHFSESQINELQEAGIHSFLNIENLKKLNRKNRSRNIFILGSGYWDDAANDQRIEVFNDEKTCQKLFGINSGSRFKRLGHGFGTILGYDKTHALCVKYEIFNGISRHEFIKKPEDFARYSISFCI